ncbi:MAG: hypothetical protein HGA19_16785 [Oscillochloris sp.]|nr:hypothetical protein [Oscillochloris sp.]
MTESIARRAVEYAGDRYARYALGGDLKVTTDDLRAAIEDYRSNADLTLYDYQSLLAIKACNFYSVMPLFPEREPFTTLVESRATELSIVQMPEDLALDPFWRKHAISYARLDETIQQHRRRIGAALNAEGR